MHTCIEHAHTIVYRSSHHTDSQYHTLCRQTYTHTPRSKLLHIGVAFGFEFIEVKMTSQCYDPCHGSAQYAGTHRLVAVAEDQAYEEWIQLIRLVNIFDCKIYARSRFGMKWPAEFDIESNRITAAFRRYGRRFNVLWTWSVNTDILPQLINTIMETQSLKLKNFKLIDKCLARPHITRDQHINDHIFLFTIYGPLEWIAISKTTSKISHITSSSTCQPPRRIDGSSIDQHFHMNQLLKSYTFNDIYKIDCLCFRWMQMEFCVMLHLAHNQCWHYFMVMHNRW